MKIVFTGLPYFSKKLVDELSSFDRKNKYYFCNTYYSKIDRFKFIFHLFNADRVISFNGVSGKSKSLDWVIRFKKKLIIQWHGSDVLEAEKKMNSGVLNRKYIDYAKNFTDAIWLKEELDKLSIQTEILHFKHVEVCLDKKSFDTNNVVSYLGNNNEKFYGIDSIYLLAKTYPNIHFHLIGTDGESCEKLSNITYYGWLNQEKVKALLNEHAIFLRLTKHDGYSLSILEAIANGNFVIWNNPHPAVNYVENTESLLTVFENLINQTAKNKFERNSAALDWANQHLKRDMILSNYVKTITAQY